MFSNLIFSSIRQRSWFGGIADYLLSYRYRLFTVIGKIVVSQFFAPFILLNFDILGHGKDTLLRSINLVNTILLFAVLIRHGSRVTMANTK